MDVTRRARQHREDPESFREINPGSLDLGPLFSRVPSVPYQRSSRTSRAAAEQVASDVQRRRTLVYIAICLAGELGLAGFEIAERTGLSILSVRPRLTGLLQDGSVVETGETRENGNGYAEMVVRQAT